MQLDKFTLAYIECALWSSIDNVGNSLDEMYGAEDLSENCQRQMIEDCEAFQTDNADDLICYGGCGGHDFWLSRNGHGAGFWDYGSKAAARLQAAAKICCEVNLYVGDDSQIHS